MPPKCRITPDEGLVTEAAIQNRIEQLRKERPAKATYRRIMALKVRLPQMPEPIPAIDPNLLISKSDLTWGCPTRTICEDIEGRKDDLYRKENW
jgi:hypothetical protein